MIKKVFEIKNNEINFLNTQNNIFAIKLLDVKTKSYNFDKDIFNNLNLTLSRSFFIDFSANSIISLLGLKISTVPPKSS